MKRPDNASRHSAAVMVMFLSLGLFSCATDQSRLQAVGWTDIGNAWAELGAWDKAGDAWSRAIALDPGQEVAGYNLSRALAEAGKYDEAITRSDTYLASDPDNAAVLSIKAYSLHKAGRDGEALAVYERVVQLNGEDVASVYNLAVLLESAGRTEEATARYDAILALKPEDANASLRKGLILLAGGDPAAAIPFLQRYVDANPTSLEGRKALATVNEKAGAFANAIEILEKIVADEPQDAGSWFSLARLRLTVAADGPGGLEALENATLNGFKDAQLAATLLESKELVSAGEVRSILLKAGLLEAPATGTEDSGIVDE